ncbi:unnamed protein product [Amoebophrya sp. A120]|nr:unnamed protein product [Amoebophrya sp. A120]|eukprot:GSA120T00004367001.1
MATLLETMAHVDESGHPEHNGVSGSNETAGGVNPFHGDQHRQFLASYLEKGEDTMLAFMTAHLRTGGAYWGLNCLDLMRYDIGETLTLDQKEFVAPRPVVGASAPSTGNSSTPNGHATVGKEDDVGATNFKGVAAVETTPAQVVGTVDVDSSSSSSSSKAILKRWILDCQNPDGGFSSNPGQDSHITSTQYALLVLCLLEEDDEEHETTSTTSQNVNGDSTTRGAAINKHKRRIIQCLETETIDIDLNLLTEQHIQEREGRKRENKKTGEHEQNYGAEPEAKGAQGSGTIMMTRKEAILRFVQSRQLPRDEKTKGACFAADKWGENDTRFVYGAFSICRVLLRDDATARVEDWVNVDAACAYLRSCYNPDGGFGWKPGSESHAASCWVCLAALSLVNRIDSQVDRDQTGWFLCSRQTDFGGFNGRPEKAPDVCYSWWILASLQIIQKMHWIDDVKLRKWILECQDTEEGGIADRPGNMPDPFHTFFGVAALSLLNFANGSSGGASGHIGEVATGGPVGFAATRTSRATATTSKKGGKGIEIRDLKPINPTFALPVDTLETLGLVS